MYGKAIRVILSDILSFQNPTAKEEIERINIICRTLQDKVRDVEIQVHVKVRNALVLTPALMFIAQWVH